MTKISYFNTVYLFNPNLRTGYVHHFGLSLQREIMRNTVVEAGYVGTRGVKLFMDLDLNEPRIYGDFLQAFKEIEAFRATGAQPPATNTLVRLFGSAQAALTTLGATNFQQGQIGTVANAVDRQQYTRYAGNVSDFYLRNYTQFNQMIWGTNDGRSYYDSLQFTVRRQAGALRTILNYTFSKSLDNISVDGNGFTSPIDSYNVRLNKARSDADIPHSFNGIVIYTLPIGKGRSFGSDMPGWADRMVGGWDVGSTMIWQSGTLLTVHSGRTTNGLATASTTAGTWANYSSPDRNIGSVERKGDGVYFWTTEERQSFGFPAAGEVGTGGRNGFRGARFFNLDLSVVKRFAINERHAINFRWEFYNLLNHANFSATSLGVNLLNPVTFGKFSAQIGNPRIMQLALRYDF